ncbi:MAG: hypothetical protein ACSLE1_17270 [Sphingobium sp.]
MPFGQIIASHVQHGTSVPLQSGIVSAEYLCDGLSRPNPGPTKMVVHDGTSFFKLHQPDGASNRAIYTAIKEALGLAELRGATHVEISLPSGFVWGQVTGNGGVRKLIAERDLVLLLAERFHSVTWHLVYPPFSVSAVTVASTRRLRRMAP